MYLQQCDFCAGVGPSKASGCTTMGRFTRLELIDPEADAAVFGDANLSNFAVLRSGATQMVGQVRFACFLMTLRI